MDNHVTKTLIVMAESEVTLTDWSANRIWMRGQRTKAG
jgi:hypothetical protein